MKRLQFLVLAATLVGLFCSLALAEPQTSVKVATKEGLGSYLVNKDGMTLYWCKNDSLRKSSCTGECLEKWPVYNRRGVPPAAPLAANDFTLFERPDGIKQSSFRGYPLYFFAGDKAPGDTNGQGLKEIWYVVNPDQFPPKKK